MNGILKQGLESKIEFTSQRDAMPSLGEKKLEFHEKALNSVYEMVNRR